MRITREETKNILLKVLGQHVVASSGSPTSPELLKMAAIEIFLHGADDQSSEVVRTLLRRLSETGYLKFDE